MTTGGGSERVPNMDTAAGSWNGLDAAFLERLVTKAPTSRRRPQPPAPTDFTLTKAPRSAPVPLRAGRDSAPRVGAIASLDVKHRVSLKRILTHLDWTAQSELVTELTPEGVIVRGRRSTDGALVGEGRLDDAGRLLLTPPVRATLDLLPRDRVHAVALPTLGQVRLFPERDVLAALTGPLETPVPTSPTPTTKNSTSRVRKARYAA